LIVQKSKEVTGVIMYNDTEPNQYNVVNDVAIRYGSPAQNHFSLVSAAHEGVSVAAFFDLLDITGLSQVELASLLDVSAKTMTRYRQEGKKLNALNSEQVLKIIALYQKGIEVFGSLGSFNRWLRKPAFGLHTNIPLVFLQTSGGIDLILEELVRLEYGALA
jgi:putative toxin-antitoxin system antitoxin component (TIGR02293 family)